MKLRLRTRRSWLARLPRLVRRPSWYADRAMTSPLLDAFDLVAHAEVLDHRLSTTAAELEKLDDRSNETAWLVAAQRLVSTARGDASDLLLRALRHPELEPARNERGRALQSRPVDAVEHLLVAIQATFGERSPLIEAISRNLKLPAMRRCGVEEFAKFGAEIEKRLGSSYVKRLLADSPSETVERTLDEIHRSFSDWRLVYLSPPLTDAEASDLRRELEAAAHRLDMPCRQARLLAEAALLPSPELREPSGIFEKPRRRPQRASTASAAAPGAPNEEHDDPTSAEPASSVDGSTPLR